MVTRFIVVSISQSVQMWKNYFIYFKLMLYVNYSSIFKK